ncbi:MAG: NRDE family protein [Ardenticatenales bacterium]
MTWLDDPADGYALWFNRDERPSRLPEVPPAVSVRQNVPYIAPRDSVAGGSWLGVNGHGVTVGLLNHYAADAARRAALAEEEANEQAALASRGLLVLALMTCGSVASVVERLGDADAPRAFRPFEIIALDPSGDRVRATWDGTRLTVLRGAAVRPPISSSGFDAAGVIAARAAAFERLVRSTTGSSSSAGDPAVSASAAPPERANMSANMSAGPTPMARLEAYHRSHVPERGAYSVCMHRPDARTISLTLVTVDRDAVAMRHGPGSACAAVLGPPVTLPRLARS